MPLLEELLSALSEGEVVDAAAWEVVVITVGTVDPLTVSYEVMTLTTSDCVVELETGAEVVVPCCPSELEELVGSFLLDDVVDVDVSEVVSAGTEVEVVEVGSVSEVVEVGSVEEVLEDEDEDEVVLTSAVVVGSDEDELDEESVVRSLATLETSAL